MKILVPSAGPVPDQRTVDYVMNIAKTTQGTVDRFTHLIRNRDGSNGENNA